MLIWDQNNIGYIGEVPIFEVKPKVGIKYPWKLKIVLGDYVGKQFKTIESAKEFAETVYLDFLNRGKLEEIGVIVTPPDEPDLPIAPVLLTAVAESETQAVVTWQYSPDDLEKYKITGFTATAMPGNIKANWTVGGYFFAVFRDTLLSGVNYTFTIHATNEAGDSVESNSLNVQMPIDQPPVDPPPVTTGVRGPSGTWVPNTPDYSTPANFQVNTLNDVATLLQSGNVKSGNVIEVLSDFTGKVGSDNTPGNLNNLGDINWTKNVLIRPKLGSRGKIGASSCWLWNCNNLVIAGFKIGSIGISNGTNNAFARILQDVPVSSLGATGHNSYACIQATQGSESKDNGLYEIYAPGVHLSAGSLDPALGWGAARCEVRTSGSTGTNQGTVYRPKIIGCWFGIAAVANQQTAPPHGDSLHFFSQNWGNPRKIVDPLVQDCVLFPSYGANFQIDSGSLSGKLTIKNIWAANSTMNSVIINTLGNSYSVPAPFTNLDYNALNQIPHSNAYNGQLPEATTEIYNSDIWSIVGVASGVYAGDIAHIALAKDSRFSACSAIIDSAPGTTIDANLKTPPPVAPNLDAIWPDSTPI